MQRLQTLHVIDVSYAPYLHNSEFISIEKLLKQSSSKRYKFSIDLPCYKDDLSICPYITLQEFISRTNDLRGQSTQLP